jgi:hypothetical protein
VGRIVVCTAYDRQRLLLGLIVESGHPGFEAALGQIQQVPSILAGIRLEPGRTVGSCLSDLGPNLDSKAAYFRHMAHCLPLRSPPNVAIKPETVLPLCYQRQCLVELHFRDEGTLFDTKTFKAGLAIHGREITSGDMVFQVHLAEDGKDFDGLAAELRTRSQQERKHVFWAIALTDAIDRETVELFRSKEMLARKERETKGEDTPALIAEERVRLRRHSDELRRLLRAGCRREYRRDGRKCREGWRNCREAWRDYPTGWRIRGEHCVNGRRECLNGHSRWRVGQET